MKRWDLVCDRYSLASMSKSVVFAGYMVGVIFGGVISDKFGRKQIVYFPSVICNILGLAASFVNAFWLFTALRGIIGICIGSSSLSMYVLLVEYVGVRHRASAGISMWYFFTSALMLLALIAFLVRDWRVLSIVAAAPGLLQIFFWWFLPESFRWYMVRGKVEKGRAVLSEVARFNKKDMPDNPIKVMANKQRAGDFRDLFRSWKALHITLVNWFLWCVISMVYYGVTFSAGNFGANRYLEFFLTSLVEIPSHYTTIISLKRLGRKKTVLIGMIVASIASTAAVLLQRDLSDTGFLVGRIIMSMAAKFFINMSFDAIYVFSAELFPTVIRNIGMGTSSAAARIGSISAPFVAGLRNKSMADRLFLEKQRDAGESGRYGVSCKIRKIGFPIAVVCCILLMIICIVLAILYSKEVNKPAIVPKEKPEYEICDDDHCFNVGIEMVRKMNKKVDPCEDFYAYACEGWQNRHPLDNDSDSENSVTKLIEIKNQMMIKKALETDHLNYSENSAVIKTIRYYESCMNVTAADALGLQPLKVLLQEYGGWTVSSNYDSTVTIATRIGKTFRELGVKSLFGVFVEVDRLDSSKTIMQLAGSSIQMQRDSFLEDDDESRKKRQAYKNILKTIGKMLGASGGSSDEKMMAIYGFEKGIAQIAKENHLDIDDDDHELTYHLKKRSRVRRHSKNDARATLLSFCNSSDVSWPFVKETLSIIFRRNFTGNEEIVFEDTFPEYFKAIYSLFKNTKESVVADYIMWQVVRKYLWALPEKFNSTALEFNRITNDSTSATPRSRECFDSLSSAFDLTLGLLYVDVMFKDDPKEKIEDMFENVRSTFVDRLKKIKWLDSPTKEKAIQKALTMKADIGYPSFIKDCKKLDSKYEMLNITDNLFTNYKAKNQFEILRNLNTYGKPVGKDIWGYRSFVDVNGMYVAQQNKIVVLAGILNPPWYSPNNPMYLNYGGVGMIIGHEIVHGFDEHGRPFDSNGNNKNWWSEYSEAKYKQKAKCLEKKYSQYTFMGKRVNGSLTLDENTADDGGVKVAYEAYQRWTRKHGPEKILPGMTLNPDQLFFLGFAQGWCSVLSAKVAHDNMETDPHTIPKYRIIGSLSNFDKFSEAFECPSNSPMNAKTKCSVW